MEELKMENFLQFAEEVWPEFKKTLKELWEEALDKKKKLKEFTIKKEECKECEHFEFCKSGCLVTARTKGCV